MKLIAVIHQYHCFKCNFIGCPALSELSGKSGVENDVGVKYFDNSIKVITAIEGEKPRNFKMQHIRIMYSAKNTAWHLENAKEFKLVKHKL